ncbi:MAG: hypothetical protein GWN01_08515 [Nitrosopumilaceae archaeon]|nr:hypothetical protein [Nitrosopumilaceae archaeon]NIU00957.1 hypothetical protein [Nitrosopumilaceae archaeon]NIU87415.1 hypothetical protein [Nitrosopumilaceae archaeon]NIV65937.1 hypothetical protein [Nitrosopumilaceae archaeon]NIX61559.1 hypothetical protein [Nitrosopumilaceae archaeon]
MDLEKFRQDVYEITERLSRNLDEEKIPKLNYVRQRLIEMYQLNLVKINHSVLELICASNLIARGYSVDVEKQVSDILVCDIFAQKGDGDTIIEIETGFTPPEHALDTVDYFIARIMSKVARYSQYCSKFSLATPVIGLLPIPKIFLVPPNARTKEQVNKVKALCDRFYKNPPIAFDDILNAHLHSIYLIHIDQDFAKELDPFSYVDLTGKLMDYSEISY